MPSNKLKAAMTARATPKKAVPAPMIGLLTNEQWAEAMPPFYWVKVTYDTWSDVEYNMAAKYAGSHATSWVYYNDQRFIFGAESDATVFQLWLRENVFEGKTGTVS